MNQDQLVAIVTGVAKVIGTALTVHGATAAAAIITAPDVIQAVVGLIITLGSFYASHQYNSTPTPKP